MAPHEIPGLADARALLTSNAADVDRLDRVPEENFAALARAGLYGAVAPASAGGLGLRFDEFTSIVEQLAEACLATTFVWIQHFRLAAAVQRDDAPTWLRNLCRAVVTGDVKGGVVLGSLLPGPTRLHATKSSSGWRLDGVAPWVSGWGIVDALLVAARGPDDTVLSFYLPATAREGLKVLRQRLAAINATSTVRLEFSSLELDDDALVARVPYAPDREAPEGLRANGSLALGLARRSTNLLGPSPLDGELEQCRAALDDADAASMANARARACALALRAAHALSVARGSASVLAGDVAERTAREASLLLTFGSRPAIRSSLLREFGAAGL